MAPDLKTNEFVETVGVFCRREIVPRARLKFLRFPVGEVARSGLAKLNESCLVDQYVSFRVELEPTRVFNIDTSFHYFGLFHDGVFALNIIIKPLGIEVEGHHG